MRKFLFVLTMAISPLLGSWLGSMPAKATPQSESNQCGGTQEHCAILSWQASPTQATCLPTNTPACAFTYNVMAGTTPGGEASTPVGQTSSLSFIYPVTLGAAQQTFYFTVVAQTTTTESNGTIVAKSAPSNEASAGPFPPAPQPPTVGPPTNVGTVVPCTPARKQACRENRWGCCQG